jgi:hypothetical protein
MAAVRYKTAPERSLSVDLATRPRAHPPLPVVQLGTFAATQAGFAEDVARSEASRCFRCDAVYGCPSVTVLTGRGPHEAVHPVPPPSPAPAAMQSIAGGDLQ